MTLELYYCFKEWVEENGIEDTNQNLLSFLDAFHLLNSKRINKFFKEWAKMRADYPEYEE